MRILLFSYFLNICANLFVVKIVVYLAIVCHPEPKLTNQAIAGPQLSRTC